jgi:hypothetical protein
VNLARWKQGGLGAAPAIAVALAAVDPCPASAQAVPEAPMTAEPGDMLGARDAVVLELMRWNGEPERLTGAPSAPPDPAVAALPAPEPSAPTGEAPAARDAAPTVAQVAPGELVIDEEAVERALERALVQVGALLLPPGGIEVEPGFSYVRREDQVPVTALVDGEVVATAVERRRNTLAGSLTLRLGLPLNLQLEAGVPYGYEDVSDVTRLAGLRVAEVSRDDWGLGDVTVGLAAGLLRERAWWPTLIGRVDWDSRTGGTGDVGLGTGFHEITGSLIATKRLDPLVFVGSGSYTFILEHDDVDPGNELGFSLGAVLAASPEASLRLFLSQIFADETEVGGQTIPGSDVVSTSLIVGASVIVTPRILLDISVGIGLTDDAPDYSIGVSLPIRFDLPFRF